WSQYRRAVVFALIALAIAWVQMALTARAGGSVHHIVLLWPLPQFIVACSLAERKPRFVPLLLIWINLLVIRQYYNKTVQNGPTPWWSEAVLTLSDDMTRIPARKILCLDWGILEQLRFLHQGKLPLAAGNIELSKPEMTAQDNTAVEGMISLAD